MFPPVELRVAGLGVRVSILDWLGFRACGVRV